jgi:hypothetical protein
MKKRNTPKHYNKKIHPIKSQEEKNEAFKRANKIIDDLNLNDKHLLTIMSGKHKGGVYWRDKKFTVSNSDVVWEMMENGLSYDDIINKIYKLKGNFKKPSKYKKEKYGKEYETKKKTQSEGED